MDMGRVESLQDFYMSKKNVCVSCFMPKKIRVDRLVFHFFYFFLFS